MGAVSADQRAPSGPLPAGARLGRYEILAKLAAGGMAIVYVARAQGVAGFERLVAIKVLHSNLAHEEEFIRMFLDEARLAASIRHPNVVPTIDISDSEKSGYFIVMEYIEGDHLGQLLSNANKAHEKLPISVTLRMIADALGGLGAAHDLCDENGRPQNLVHRDVSPHNIMVGRDGVARLTDFGVAKAEDRLTHTRDGQVKGKLAYMAPEQAASGATDTRSDLFSMGVILWECVTGQRLMRAESTAATLHKLLHGEVPTPSSLDPELAPLDAVLEKALAREPEQRFQSAEEFAQALEDVSGKYGGMASLREVGKIVKQYAAVKLKRDKRMIEEALKALRPAEVTAGEDGDGNEDASSSEISIVAGAAPNLVSKVSGVFANDTMPGTRRAGRRTVEVPLPERRPPTAPPPAGMTRPSPAYDLPLEIEDPFADPLPGGLEEFDGSEGSTHTVRKVRWAVLLLSTAALVMVAVWTGSSSTEVVHVEEMRGPVLSPTLIEATSAPVSPSEAVPQEPPESTPVGAAVAPTEIVSDVVVGVAEAPTTTTTVSATVVPRTAASGSREPLVRSSTSNAQAVGSSTPNRTREPSVVTREPGVVVKSPKIGARRVQRETIAESPANAPIDPPRLPDVMPNPYHN